MANANHRIFGSTPIPRYVQLAEVHPAAPGQGPLAACAGAISM